MIKAYDLNYWFSEVDNICRDIDKKIREYPLESRDSISSDTLKHLRDLVEHVAVCCFLKDSNEKNQKQQYDYIEKGMDYIKGKSKFSSLYNFHEELRASVSHYSLYGDSAERMMLKYLTNLVSLKNFYKAEFGKDILTCLELFPLDMDVTFQSYYRKILQSMNQIDFKATLTREKDTYYVRKKKMISIDNHLFFEYTLSPANDNLNKFDRFTVFSPIDVFENYAIKASVLKKEVTLFDKKVSVYFLTDYLVSIRPCEFLKLFNIVGLNENKNYSPGNDYLILMKYIQENRMPLDKILEMSNSDFNKLTKSIIKSTPTLLYRFLLKSRILLNSQVPGKSVFKYLLHTIDNRILNDQLAKDVPLNDKVQIWHGDCLFDTMPFVYSLRRHNPKFDVLSSCFPIKDHEGELIKRYIAQKSNSESMLYIQIENKNFENVKKQVENFNESCNTNKLGNDSQLSIFGKYVFENSLEKYTHDVLACLLYLSTSSSSPNLSNYVISRMSEISLPIDDPVKKAALKSIYRKGSLFAVYGSAGTGKTTFAKYLLDILGHDIKVMCVTNTNPALMNLRNKLASHDVSFHTVYGCTHLQKGHSYFCDLLIIDECSTISNEDILQVLRNIKFKFILLLGDVHQIAAIQFGNWFSMLNYFLPNESKVELKTPYRAVDNKELPIIWESVRNGSPKIQEFFVKHRISKPLSSEIFNRSCDDEIVLCLNYDGLYGINNINNYLQESNPQPPIHWKQYTFKVGDPILFTENSRFGSVLYNNLKGTIIKIEESDENFCFQILVCRSINPITDIKGGLKLLKIQKDGKSLVEFSVKKTRPKDYEKDMENEFQIPFNIAYAVSIHKAQGLEYDSVKIVLSNEIEELVTHNIFYTAITRARKDLTIYWTPETENKIIQSLKFDDGRTDFNLLRARFKDLKQWSENK